MNKKQIKKWCAAISAIVVFVLIVTRAAIMTITFDEAYTYFGCALNLKLNMEGIKELYLTSNTNNHMIKTILITLMDQLTHSHYVEWMIRFPNILAAALYLFVLYRMYLGQHINAVVYYTLISCYYVNEFFSLARGYGLAISLLTLCLCLYLLWRESGFVKIIYPCFIMVCYMLACMANTICLLLAPALGLLCLINLIRTKTLGKFILYFWYGIVITSVGIIAMLFYHLRVTADGNEILYVVNSDSFFEAFFQNFGEMISSNSGIAFVWIMIVIGCCVAGCVLSLYQLYRKQKTHRPDFILMFLSLAVLIFLEGIVGEGKFATGRAMVPLFTVVVFSLQDTLDYIKEGVKKRGILLVGSVIVMVISAQQWCVTTTREFPSDMNAKAYGYMTQYTEEREYDGFNITIAHFYAEQAKYLRSFE